MVQLEVYANNILSYTSKDSALVYIFEMFSFVFVYRSVFWTH